MEGTDNLIEKFDNMSAENIFTNSENNSVKSKQKLRDSPIDYYSDIENCARSFINKMVEAVKQ